MAFIKDRVDEGNQLEIRVVKPII